MTKRPRGSATPSTQHVRQKKNVTDVEGKKLVELSVKLERKVAIQESKSDEKKKEK